MKCTLIGSEFYRCRFPLSDMNLTPEVTFTFHRANAEADIRAKHPAFKQLAKTSRFLKSQSATGKELDQSY